MPPAAPQRRPERLRVGIPDRFSPQQGRGQLCQRLDPTSGLPGRRAGYRHGWRRWLTNCPAGQIMLCMNHRGPTQPGATGPRPDRAVTLVELLVVMAILGLLASLLLPALGRARARADGLACLNNLKQLQLAWQMYGDDFQGRVPPNRSVWTNGLWRSTPDSWIGASSAPHDPDPAPIEQGLFFRLGYNRALALYRCPADGSRVRTPQGRELGLRRTRSYSMNGIWGGRANEMQTTVERADAVAEPARLFVFVDEAEDSIDDAHFLVWPAPDVRWVNLPAGRHAQRGVLSFADGRAELWVWQWPKRFHPRQSYWKTVESLADWNDLRRLQAATLPRADFVPQTGYHPVEP